MSDIKVTLLIDCGTVFHWCDVLNENIAWLNAVLQKGILQSLFQPYLCCSAFEFY